MTVAPAVMIVAAGNTHDRSILIDERLNSNQEMTLNSDVTKFLDNLNHPFRQEIEALRQTILRTSVNLSESIKWNAPNYSIRNEDRITMRIHPPKQQVQLIFHRGATVQEQPQGKLIQENSGLLIWKENDRAVATFKDMDSIVSSRAALDRIVQDWISATS